MKKNAILLLAMVAAGLASCGGSPGGNETQAAQVKGIPLDANPPFGADDIDSTVAETRKRMEPAPARPSNPNPQNAASGNSQDALSPDMADDLSGNTAR